MHAVAGNTIAIGRSAKAKSPVNEYIVYGCICVCELGAAATTTQSVADKQPTHDMCQVRVNTLATISDIFWNSRFRHIEQHENAVVDND